MSTATFQHDFEPCLARLGTTPEGNKHFRKKLAYIRYQFKIYTHLQRRSDKPSFVKEVYALDDIETLRQLIIKKERERQAIANDLEVAARIGLVISETNEAIQIKVMNKKKKKLVAYALKARTSGKRKQNVSRRIKVKANLPCEKRQ